MSHYLRLAQVLFAANAVVSFGAIPNAHPHIIRDGRDAIATAATEWKAQYPESGAEIQLWQKENTATLKGGVWTIRQIMDTPDDPRGTTIYLDANDGHIISAKIVD